jgi:uncharacterized membrane protein YdjX (TVP38/TMEM64 family)
VINAVLVIALLAATWWLGRTCFSNEDAIRAFFEKFPFGLAAALFIVLYAGSSFILFDVKDILKVAGALLFGAWWSTLFIWIAELINNAMLFHLARRLGRVWIERKFNLHGHDVGWVEKFCGVWQIFVLRILPIIPYRILDVAYGLTAVPFRRYFTVSALASPLRIFWLQFILAGVGGAVFEPQKLTDYLLARPEIVRFGALYLFFAVGAAILVGRKFK